MIFYFSGTGNSKWVAHTIAANTKDIAYNIVKIEKIPNIEKEEFIGLVFPIYAWGVPEIMSKFIKQLPDTNAFTYGICTCGANAGLAMKKLSHNFRLDSCYSVVMPNNYIIGSDIENQEIVMNKITNAKIMVEGITKDILHHKKNYHVCQGSLPLIKTTNVCFGFNKFARSTKPFSVNSDCIGCGICAKECPAKTIEVKDSKPLWHKKCYQCLRCINYCPVQAIQYGQKTQSRGRYIFENKNI